MDSPPPPTFTPPPLKSYTLTATSISYTKTTNFITQYYHTTCSNNQPTYILNNVSLTANPSQILAVVGPSGAGKSTLLDILSARTYPTTGHLYLNSTPILQNPSSYRKLCAYVPQHDTSLSLLTVSETFHFAATLLHEANNGETVSSLLDELGLTHLTHTRLGNGLSGGEMRRVSIGLSLLHDPGVLILDEPTSGLDSGSAFNVMQTLKTIVMRKKRTVVVSIHQPSFRILELVDTVLLMANGSVVYHGSLVCLEKYLGEYGFEVPDQLNALEYAMEILGQLVEVCSKLDDDNILVPSINKDGDMKLKLGFQTSGDGDGDGDCSRLSRCSSDGDSTGKQRRKFTVRYKSSRVHEIRTLHTRFCKLTYRTKQLLLTNTLESLLVGLTLGTIYINTSISKSGIQNRLGLFAFTLTFLLSSTAESSLPIFITNRPILLHETSSGIYRLSSYIIANTLLFIPYYLLAVAVLYSVSVYFLAGLCFTPSTFGYFTLIVWLVTLMANSFVLFIGSIAPNYIAGTSLVTILLASFFLFSGYFISKERLPKYWVGMHFLSMYKYALDALLINEYSCLASECFVWYDERSKSAGCMLTGRDVLEKRGLDEGQRWVNVYVLLGFFVMYRVLCFIVLITRVSRSKT